MYIYIYMVHTHKYYIDILITGTAAISALLAGLPFLLQDFSHESIHQNVHLRFNLVVRNPRFCQLSLRPTEANNKHMKPTKQISKCCGTEPQHSLATALLQSSMATGSFSFAILMLQIPPLPCLGRSLTIFNAQ